MEKTKVEMEDLGGVGRDDGDKAASQPAWGTFQKRQDVPGTPYMLCSCSLSHLRALLPVVGRKLAGGGLWGPPAQCPSAN